MTLDDVKAIPREYLIPCEVAAVLGTDGQSIRVWARQCPEGLGFPTVCVGNRVKIPKAGFIAYMEGRNDAAGF